MEDEAGHYFDSEMLEHESIQANAEEQQRYADELAEMGVARLRAS